MEKSRITVGSRLVVELYNTSGGCEKMEVTIVPDRAADFARGLLGESTPLGRTLLDQPVGAMLAYAVGDLKAVRVLSISTADENLIEESVERRQQEVERTHREIDRQNAANFAASFSGKWGDYDPDGLLNWDLNGEDQESPQDEK